MIPAPSSAPADHFHPARTHLQELRARLAGLSKALPLWKRCAGGTHHGLISACAAIVAYLPTHALGLKEGFWASITAISVVQTEFQATESTARDQFIGAMIGGLVGMVASFVPGPHLLVYAVALLAAVVACWALNLASASRLSGSTVTILLLVPHTGSVFTMFGARLGEVGWGVCVAVVTVWLAARLPAWLHHTGGTPTSATPP
jgi:uncharacterized membrane protein YccC